LYDKEGNPKIEDLKVEDEKEVDEGEKGPEVLKSEILLTISEMNEGKATEVNEIPSKMLKNLEEGNTGTVCNLS